MKNNTTLATTDSKAGIKRRPPVFMVFLAVLLILPASLFAQVIKPSTAQMLQLRQKNNINKSALVKKAGNAINNAQLANVLSVKQADAVSNPLPQIIQSLVGPGVTVSNIQTTLPATSDIYGSFTGGTSVIGMESGLIMTSGSVFNALGPNISEFTSQNNGLPGYLVSDTAGYDAAVISFDVTSSTSFLSFKYVFASEEYNEYVGSPFNDEFAFFISGPGIPAGTNIALIPGTSTPVTINNVNLGLNSQYYINNDSAGHQDPVKFQNLEYDGLTTVLTTSSITVVPGATYTITLVIQDFEDAIYDSGVFIEGGSITSDSCVLDLHTIKKDITCNGANDGSINLLLSGANGTAQFAWTNGATTEDISDLAPGSYNVTVTDEKGCTATLATPVVIVEPGAIKLGEPKITSASCGGGSNGSAILSASGGTAPYQYTVDSVTNDSGIFNDLPGGTYQYSVTDSNGCSTTGSFVIPQGSNINCFIAVRPNPVIPGQDRRTIYLGYGPQCVKLMAEVENEATGSYTYDWSNGDTGSCIKVCPKKTTTYQLTVTDQGGCQSTCSKTIKVVDVRCGNDLQKVLVCHRDSGTQQWKTICISADAVCAHLKHGDQLGACGTSIAASTEIASSVSEENKQASVAGLLSVKAFPNPATGYFTIQVGSGNAKEKISLRILDLNGHQVEIKNNIAPGQIIQIGNNYKAGIYMAELTQGAQRVTMKLVKH